MPWMSERLGACFCSSKDPLIISELKKAARVVLWARIRKICVKQACHLEHATEKPVACWLHRAGVATRFLIPSALDST